MTDRWRIDSHKLMYHPERVAQWKAADTWEKAKKLYPIYFEITSASACNHRCTFCSVDAIGYPNIMFDSETMVRRIHEAANLGVKAVMFGGTGEPLLHKRMDYIVRSAANSGVDVAFTTNGIALHRLTEIPRCSWIKVSLNAGTKESYAKIHKTNPKDWDRVWENITDAVKRKGPCTIGVQCVVLPENLYDMRALAQLCIEAGVDYLVLKPYTQATFMLGTRYKDLNYKSMDSYLWGVMDFSTDKFKVIYRSASFQQEDEKVHRYDRCYATPNFWAYAMGDGRLFTCSAHLLDARFCIGNLYENTFQELWEGDRRRQVWEMMQDFDIKQCRLNCRMDKQNQYLSEFGKVEHVNFI